MNLSKKLLTAALAMGALCAQALDIVKDGKSSFSIYVEKEAAESVVKGASELQSYCAKVTGVTMPIVNEPKEPMISLGVNAGTKAAGIALPEDLMLEGFIFKVQNGSLYILGPDTKGAEKCPKGGISNGTLNGVYTLIEDYFGVRWLMPGPDGDYVPRKATITVPDEGLKQEPGFENRRLPYVQENQKLVKDWLARQKMGFSLSLNHGHNWIRTCPPAKFDEHPEWFAVRQGRPMMPSGDYYKLCPTNPSTIKRFAEAACAYFEQSSGRTMFSLSPSDGDGWCECDKCVSMYEKDPLGKLSVTPAVIYFYNEVAKLVAPKHPGKLLGGYVYASYVFPPKKPFKLEPNVYLIWAPSFDYGYTLFRPDIQELFDSLLPQWPKITSSLAFYDLPNNIANTIGLPNAPGLEIMKFLYPRLKDNKMQGVYVYGNAAWGHAGPTNYILAKLAWNPKADVDALFKDFCDHAYQEASPEMQEIYNILDRDTKAYFIAHKEESYRNSKGRSLTVYAKNLPEFSRLFAAGEAKVTDPKAKARLEFFKINLCTAEWYFKLMGYLPETFKSVFTVDDEGYNAIMSNPRYNLMLNKDASKPPKITWNMKGVAKGESSLKVPMTPYSLRGTQTVILLAENDGDIGVAMVPNRQYGALVWGFLYAQDGTFLRQEALRPGKPMKIQAKAGDVFSLVIKCKNDFYSLQVTNARWGGLTNVTNEGLHMIQQCTPMYINVPKGVKNFDMWLKAAPPGETAKGSLITPTGRTIQFNCTEMLVDKKKLEVLEGEDGAFWRFDVTVGDKGVLDDVYVRIISGIPPVLCYDPDKLLTVPAQ